MKIEIGNYTRELVRANVVDGQQNNIGDFWLPQGQCVIEHPDVAQVEFDQNGDVFANIEASAESSRATIFMNGAGRPELRVI